METQNHSRTLNHRSILDPKNSPKTLRRAPGALPGAPGDPVMSCNSCGLCRHGKFAQSLFEGLGGKREAFTIIHVCMKWALMHEPKGMPPGEKHMLTKA